MTIKFAQEKEQRHIIQRLRVKEAEDIAQKISESTRIPYLNISFKPVDRSALELVPEQKAKDAGLAVISHHGEMLTVIVQNPEDPLAKDIIDELKAQFSVVSVFVTSEFGLQKAWNLYAQRLKKKISGQIEISQENFDHFRQVVTTIPKLQQGVAEIVSQPDVSVILELILASSVSLRASDVHIEPEEKDIRLRIRIDGVMHEIANFNQHIYRLLISRIKLLSSMKLNIHGNAQDGRFSITLENTEIQVRTSVLPGEYGENIVMRLLDPDSILSIPELGLNPDLMSLVEHELKRPNGMILVTGPTGSGKTTTLYAFLIHLATETVKIVTVEDPIEYKIEGISQTQVHPEKGYTFANGLRSILRQDPDIILVGEIRDLETVDMALQAALTGHLVFSTMHTNDSAGTIPRMIDLGASSATIGPAVNMSMAQRLVRKVCPDCHIMRKITPEELSSLREDLAMPQEALENLHYYKEITAKLTPELEVAQVKGCENCNNSGYFGQVAVYEIILIDEKLENFILENSPSIVNIREFAKSRGMTSLRQDALLKVIEGITTSEEVDRIID